MVLINKAINEVTVKLVYYGPGLCGKTTNLEKVYGNPKLENKGKMISMSTETDRTLFFDFMPMELGTIAGQKVRVQLYTVPGQVFYDATRKLVLRGADGVVFVADSQSSMRESNIDSLENLRTNLRLNRIDPDKVALVFQYNKRDLESVDSVGDMTAYLEPGPAPVIEAAAVNGVGVTATLRAAVARILDNLKNHVDTTLHEEPELAAPDMSAKAGVTSASAGTPKLSMRDAAQKPPAATGPRSGAAGQERPAQGTPAHGAPALSRSPITAPPVFAQPVSTPVNAAPFEDVFEPAASPVEADPFAAATVVDAPLEVGQPFDGAAAAADTASQRAAVESMLSNTRAIVAALESALEHARENERALQERLMSL